LRVERKKKAPECHWSKLLESKKTRISKKKMLKKSTDGKSKRGRKPKDSLEKSSTTAAAVARVANSIVGTSVQSSMNIEDAIMIDDEDEPKLIIEDSPANSVIFLSSLSTSKEKEKYQQLQKQQKQQQKHKHKRQRLTSGNGNISESQTDKQMENVNDEHTMPRKRKPYIKRKKSQSEIDLLELNQRFGKDVAAKSQLKVNNIKDKITKRLERSMDN
jgi:hypothetical protein